MNATCPRCGAVSDGQSRFCTNCGADLGTPAQAQQSWEAAPPAQAQAPSWASANPGMAYQQPQQQAMGGSLGLGTTPDQDAFIKKALLYIIAAVIAALVVLLILGILAAFLPGLRCLFFIAIFIVILIPWLIYVNIRRYIRRTVGRVGGLWWLFM
ncbi:MAG: zinc ribbon domain-containing protein [Ktedonobacteraceae bacterium]|nr:zinc ribbon domain-containing protein [Ktedonobacteraceae bacterium]